MAVGAAAGKTLGLTGPPKIPGSPIDLAQGAMASGAATAWNAGAEITTLKGTVSTATFAAASVASGLRWGKFGYDAMTFTGAIFGCGLRSLH